MTKHNFINSMAHLPAFRIELAKGGIALCVEGIKAGQKEIAQLEAKLQECEDADEEMEIINYIILINQHMEFCKEQMQELDKHADPYVHILN